MRRALFLYAVPLSLVLGFALSGPSLVYADRVDDLIRALTSDPSYRVRLQAVSVLSHIGDRRSSEALVRALGDANETVRALAAQVLGEQGGQAHLAALERATHDASALVRGKAEVALDKLRSSSAPTPAPLPEAVHVELGSVGAKAKGVTREHTSFFRDALLRELGGTPGLTFGGASSSGFLVDGSITGLSRELTGSGVEIGCEVSVIVGRLPSKAMVMMTSGSAVVQGSRMGLKPAVEARMQREAIEAAVRGAQENLVTFLKTQPPGGTKTARR